MALAAEASTSATPGQEDRTRYDTLRRELAEQLNKKRATERQLAQLETQLFNFETSYLTETMAHSGGNVIMGFDAYHKTQSSGRRKHELTMADRLFSTSSLTYEKSLELCGDGDDTAGLEPDAPIPNSSGTAASASAATLSLAPPAARGGSRGPTPGLTTVVLPPAQSAGGPRTEASPPLTNAQVKKIRDKEYQRRKRASMKALNNNGGPNDDDDGSATGSVAGGRRTKRPRLADDD